MTKLALSRRTFLSSAAATPFLLSGLIDPARAAGITVGIIYVGSRQDYGWNQAHAVGAKALKEIPGVKVVEEENVPETVAVQKTMESMISIDGATLLFPTSFGYFNPFMVDAAKKFPRSNSATRRRCGRLTSIRPMPAVISATSIRGIM
jgi:basic membrane protein A